MKQSRGLWRDVLKSLATRESWDKARRVEDEDLLEERPPRDPSLRDQLCQLTATEQPAQWYDSYLDACRKAPDASEGTKRKWRRAIGL